MGSSRQSDTVPAAFSAAIAPDPARPLLTWYDDASGERTELSGATLANWVAKTANLLVDGAGLGPGDRAAVDAPPHWQTAAVLLGCWSAGLAVVTPPGGITAVEVAFAAADRLDPHVAAGGDVFGLALAPLAAPMRAVPPGVTDFVIEVRAHGDHFTAADRVGPDDPATDRSHAEVCRAAAARAEELGIGAGDRVLIDAAAHPDPRDWLLAPLLAGASVVLCGSLDAGQLGAGKLADRVATERVTRTLAAR